MSIGGPSSSLRYSYGVGSQGSDSAPGISSSQLSYTKRSLSPPIATARVPVSGLSAMNLDSPSPSEKSRPSPPLPAQATALPATTAKTTQTAQAMSIPGSSAIRMSSSPSPSLIKRYSSSRYSRSYGQGSSGSSPGDAQTFWGPESLGRRSRLSSGRSREELTELSSAAPISRQKATGSQAAGQDQGGSSADADDIRSFLGMIDSRAQLGQTDIGSSRLLSGGDGASNKSAVFGRAQAEEKLRNLADSVYREPAATSVVSSSYNRQIPAAQHFRDRPGESSPSLLPPRQSPSSELGSISADGAGYLSTSAGTSSVRIRASQPPMSSSIPEEESHNISQPYVQRPSKPDSPTLVGGSHFPFPRYVSASMRRRGSSHSSGSGAGASVQRPHVMESQQSGNSAVPSQGEESPEQSPIVAQYETGEEQTIGQLDLSTEGRLNDQSSPNEQYQWPG